MNSTTSLKFDGGNWGSFQFNSNDDIKVSSNAIPGFKDYIYANMIDGVLTVTECKSFIEISEQFGYSESPSTTEFFRKSQLLISDMPNNINDTLSQRVLNYLPKQVIIDNQKWDLYDNCCLNKRWRFNKYVKGCYFASHYDDPREYNESKITSLSIVLYLNSGDNFGATTFYPNGINDKQNDGNKEVIISPKQGSAICFVQRGKHNPRHEGSIHKNSNTPKYIIRTDIVYIKNKQNIHQNCVLL